MTDSFIQLSLDNVSIMKDGENYMIRVNSKHKVKPSSTGKTLLLATTGSAKAFDGYNFQISIYKPNPAYKPKPK